MRDSYTINILPSAEKHLLKLPRPARVRIVNKISSLAEDPRPPGVKKLKGRVAYRIRVGNYRVVYEIKDYNLTITIIAVGDRKDIYK